MFRSNFTFPIIDLQSVEYGADSRKNTVDKLLNASEYWGFFLVVNHGIPVDLLEKMKDGVHRFFEQDTELKKRYYSRDSTKKVFHNSNFDLYASKAANWRDTLNFRMAPDPPKPEEIPDAFRYKILHLDVDFIF